MKRFDQINVIPFIDIMLVLLAIVLTTASFMATGLLDIELPNSNNKDPNRLDVQQIELTLNSDNQILIDEQLHSIDELEAALAELDRETRIILRVDKKVAFEHFVGVIDALKHKQLNHLSILTRQN